MRFIWVHIIIHFLSPVDASIGRSVSFIPQFPVRPFLGFVDEAAFPPIKFTPAYYGAAGICSLVVFLIFTRCVV